MSMTRRGLLGFLGALVAAPAAALSIKPKKTVPVGFYRDVLFFESDHVPAGVGAGKFFPMNDPRVVELWERKIEPEVVMNPKVKVR